MNLRNFQPNVEITNFEQRLPVMNDRALLRSQDRIMDLAPGEVALARAGSVHWDSYGEPGAQPFTLDTYNDYQTDGITPLYMSYMPVVMKACVTTEEGRLVEDYIADLRYMENVTSINRPMEIDPENPESSYYFRHYQRTRGAVILKTLLLPGIDGATLWCKDPLFADPALDLADKVDRLFVRYHATGNKPQAIDYMQDTLLGKRDRTA
jgi:hypothetical protein